MWGHGTVEELWVAPDETLGQGPAPEIQWYIGLNIPASEVESIGWGFSSNKGWGTSQAGPEGFISHFIKVGGVYTGGYADWWKVPQYLIDGARALEGRNSRADYVYSDSTYTAGLQAFCIPVDLLNSSPPAAFWPVNAFTRYIYRANSRLAVKVKVKPQRYRTKLSDYISYDFP
jgi:hypothetical protein